MRKLRIPLLAVTLIATALSQACTGSVSTRQTSQVDSGALQEPNSIDVSRGVLGGPNKQARLIGRFDLSDPAQPRFSLPNSKIGATFTGTSLGVMLADSGSDALNVVLDGVPLPVLTPAISASAQTYTLATNLKEGSHTVWLTKRTEAQERDQSDGNNITGTITFAGFKIDAQASFLAPPAGHNRLIEAIGDSSFNGYGADQIEHDSNDTCVYTTATQNADLSVPAYLAAQLNAELVNVSLSGKGIVNSPYDPNNTPHMLPAAYMQTVPPKVDPAWSDKTALVDAVVMNAGGDDLFGAYGSGYFPDPNAFVSTYTALLATIRAQHPQASIFCVTPAGAINGDRATLLDAIKMAVASRVALGDSHVMAIDYFANDPNGWQSYSDASYALGLYAGCEGHPSPAGASFLAGRIAPIIRATLGW